MDEWLEKRDRLEVQLRGKYSEEIVNDLLRMVDKFINYNEQFLNHWRSVGGEVKELIDNLMSGKAEVIIWEGEKGTSVYGEHVTLEVNKSTGGITVCLVLSDLGGVTIRIPDVFAITMSKEEYEKFINEVLRALRGGLEEADGVVFKGKAAMGTTQIWQVIAWALLYPSVHVLIDAINVNESDVSITWYLKTTVEALKGKILKNVGKLSKEEVLAFMFTAVLGDGSAEIIKVIRNGRVYDEAVIKMTMSDERYKVWEPLFDRLRRIGFRSGKPSLSNSNVVNVRFNSGNAIDLARAIINVLPPVLRDIFDALAFEKWERIKRIAEMELKFRKGGMQVDVTGYRFTVAVYGGTVVLIHQVRDGVEAEKVIDALKVKYGNEFYAYINKRGKYLAVIVPAYVVEKYDDIKEQVIEVLCRRLGKTKDEKKKEEIAKAIKRLAPTKGDGSGQRPIFLTNISICSPNDNSIINT